MKYRPNEGRVLLKKLKEREHFAVGNLVVPGKGLMDRELCRGVIVVGNNEIKPGTIVWYSSYSASILYDEDLGRFTCLAVEDIVVFEETGQTEKTKDELKKILAKVKGEIDELDQMRKTVAPKDSGVVGRAVSKFKDKRTKGKIDIGPVVMVEEGGKKKIY